MTYEINNKEYKIYKNEDIVLNNKNIIIGRYKKIKETIYNIKYYNEEEINYELVENKLKEIKKIKIKDEIEEEYYILDKYLYKNNFIDFIEYKELDIDKLELKNEIIYEKINNIYNINKNFNKKIILLDENIKNYYYKDNYIYNNENRYLCLCDDNYKNIYIKREKEVYKYINLLDNKYLEEEEYNLILKKNINKDIFKYFINNLDKEIIELIKEDKIIYNIDRLNERYIFLEEIDFELMNKYDIDIYKVYGYLIIEENKIKEKENNFKIINLKDNKNLIENQELWINYLDEVNDNLILIFDDYSYYEFMKEAFELEKKIRNYIILINYSKSSNLIHFYINNLIKKLELNLEEIEYIIDINKVEESEKIKQDDIIIDKDIIKMVSNKKELIILMIYFYIKNKNKIEYNKNIKMDINDYKKIKFNNN